jgi:hypothetical protein
MVPRQRHWKRILPVPLTRHNFLAQRPGVLRRCAPPATLRPPLRGIEPHLLVEEPSEKLTSFFAAARHHVASPGSRS